MSVQAAQKKLYKIFVNPMWPTFGVGLAVLAGKNSFQVLKLMART